MNKHLRLIPLFFILVATTNSYSQQMAPLELAKRIFGRDSLPDMSRYIKGEYEGKPNGQDISEKIIPRFLLLEQNDSTAVVAMTLTDSTGRGLDTYLHFEKDTTWKMAAFRALAMTGMIERTIQELEQMTPQQVDEIIAASKKQTEKDRVIFTSREDYAFELGNARLTLMLDDSIIGHFLRNKPQFETIKNALLKELAARKPDQEPDVDFAKAQRPEYRKLFISSVSTRMSASGSYLNFSIGGILDNTVGYIYAADKKDLPAMSPSEYIMLREIGGGWYIYKTT